MKRLLIVLLIGFHTLPSVSQPSVPYPESSTWNDPNKTIKVQIYKGPDDRTFGKIVWMKDPTDENGRPKIDINNPVEKLRNQRLVGLVVMKNFKRSKQNPNLFEDGTFYDPKTGNSYCGKFEMVGKELKVTGHICGWSFLVKRTTWTKAD